jgi:hypothetical protein
MNDLMGRYMPANALATGTISDGTVNGFVR